ncbi:MAG: aminoglycoside phosphotransferase family protein [Candidatus Methylacidiphilales bacterium]|nr:phosphotransferase [Candidatus Methylacidiphilales bacterium]
MTRPPTSLPLVPQPVPTATTALLGQLRAATCRQFGWEDSDDLVLQQIMQGGSDRSFYRVLHREEPEHRAAGFILVRYTDERPENAYYAPMAGFLGRVGVRGPAVLAHDESARLIWMEDLGASDLYALRHLPWAERAPYYQLALQEVRRLHTALTVLEAEAMATMEPFSPKLYAWEHDYFLHRFVEEICGLQPDRSPESPLGRELADLGARLSAAPAGLVHRDFQSQNVMVCNQRACLIDFQGMRRGTPCYDLGSLLYDPYVEIPHEARLEMVQYYFSLEDEAADSGSGTESEANRERHELFHEASAQRLMQALGAYGFLSLHKGKPHFLRHIEPALRNLTLALEGAPRLVEIREVVRQCREIQGV